MHRLLLILMILGLNARADDWKPYEGSGWKASLPASLYEQVYSEKQRLESPGWRHSTLFESKDESVSLRVYTLPLGGNEPLHVFFKEKITERTDEKAVINYTFIKDSWFVVSGTNSLGFEFYTKFWRYEDHWVEFIKYCLNTDRSSLRGGSLSIVLTLRFMPTCPIRWADKLHKPWGEGRAHPSFAVSSSQMM
jgi:hypothetical protein